MSRKLRFFRALSVISLLLAVSIPVKIAWERDLNLITDLPTIYQSMGSWSIGLIFIFLFAAFEMFMNSRPNSEKNDSLAQSWWDHPERKKLNIPMIVDTSYNQPFSVATYDISVGGAYIRLTDMQQGMNTTGLTGTRTGLKIGDLMKLKIQVTRFHRISCKGLVVRVEKEAQGAYPEGIGIQFLSMGKKDQSRLQQLLQSLDDHKIAS